ncbi:cytochrome p450 [Moniliophthora roreri]|nr:cytochrome p450 [Moniliophthora roreri]
MRWHPAIPMGEESSKLLHTSTEDDRYSDYDIPQGSIVFANVWAMTHDERVYADPYKFNPERFLDVNGRLNDDDTILGFGFGRRICVGQHFADAIMWLTIASVLTCFKISRARDVKGNEIEIEEKYSDGPGLLSPRHPEVGSLLA